MDSPVENKVIRLNIDGCSFEQFKKTVDSLMGTPALVLIGGSNAVAHPEFQRLVRYLSAKIPPKKLAPAITNPISSFASFCQKNLLQREGVSLGLVTPVNENYYRHFELIQECFGFQQLSVRMPEGQQPQPYLDQQLHPRQVLLCSLNYSEKLPMAGLFDSRISQSEAEQLRFQDWLLAWNGSKPYRPESFAALRKAILNPGCLYYATDNSFWLLNRNAAALEGRESLSLNLRELQRIYTRGKCVSFGNPAYQTLIPTLPAGIGTQSKTGQPHKINYSFLVPVYNCADSLRACLDSILAQTVQDFELICCDDGSTDDSLKILREYEKNDSRIKVLVHAANQNAAIARFNLIDAAQAEYSVFVDSDDTIAPDFLEQANHVLQTEERYDIVEFPYDRVDAGGKRIPWPSEKERALFGRDIFNFFLYSKLEPWTLWGKVIRTSLLISCPQHRIRQRYFNDCLVAFSLYYFACSYRFYDGGHPLYYYYLGRGGLGKKISLQTVRTMSLCARRNLQKVIAFADFYGITGKDQISLILGRCNNEYLTGYLISNFVKKEEQAEALRIFRQLTDDLYAPYRALIKK